MKTIKQKIGLIGVGNMGTSILDGLLDRKIIRPDLIWVCDKITAKSRAYARQKRVHLANSNLQLAANVDLIILAVKPQDLYSTADELADLDQVPAVLSILAGIPIGKIKKAFGNNVPVIRAMPNLGAKVGQSMTALTGAGGEWMALAAQIFAGCGKTVQLEEKYFDLVTALSGSGPAYFFLLMELLIKAGKKNGLNEKQAQLLAVQTAVGSALLAASSAFTPAQLREMVTSKGGTTAAALNVFNQHNIAAAVSEAVGAALKRGKELAKG